MFKKLPSRQIITYIFKKFRIAIFSFCIIFGCIFCFSSCKSKGMSSFQDDKLGQQEYPIINEKTVPATLENNFQFNDILYQGETTLFAKVNENFSSYGFDLDNPIENSKSYELIDLELHIGTGSMLFPTLVPVNGALAYFESKVDNNEMNCANKLDTFSKGSIPEFIGGEEICIFTNQNRIAIVQYKNGSLSKDDSGNESAIILYTVWKQIMPNPN